MHYLLFYDYVPDILDRRGPFRLPHLNYARAAQRRGELVLGGAYAEPVDGAALLFKADSPAVPEAFAKGDPYVTGGLVTNWRVRQWSTVIGADACVELPPDMRG
jgi:uncharacterized protein